MFHYLMEQMKVLNIKILPVFSVQYHPEASPGPHDSHYYFEEFYNLISKYAKKN